MFSIVRALRTLALLALLLPLTGCGYALAGRGSFLPDYVRTIGVPQFTNNTPLFDIERLVTERVRSEFIGRGKWKVFPERDGTDALLLGEISSITFVPSAFNAQQQATRYTLIVTAKIEFRDLKADKVLWSNPAMQFRDEYEVTNVTSPDPTAFFGQNANALQRLAQELARSIVSAILEAF
jgi:outer membrane lipopolysaccharide assembly protein LptE/RlpB